MDNSKVIWQQKARIRSAIIFGSICDEPWILNMNGDIKQITLSVPEADPDERWTGWQTMIHSTWFYDVQILFETDQDDNDAIRRIGYRNVDDFVNISSFIASAPIRIESYGALQTPPGEAVAGQEYRSIILGITEGHLAPRERAIFPDGLSQLLMPLLNAKVFHEKGGERIRRSLRWLQHSYNSSTPVDEFLCLMLALEGISSLLGDPQKVYWRCSNCQKEFKKCPNCGSQTTGRLRSGDKLIRDFVHTQLGWSKKQWDKLWSLRCKIAHGDQDLGKADEIQIIQSLTDLETATLSALKHTLNIHNKVSPTENRFRPITFSPSVQFAWKPPDEEKT